jgi:hypothetical protein
MAKNFQPPGLDVRSNDLDLKRLGRRVRMSLRTAMAFWSIAIVCLGWLGMHIQRNARENAAADRLGSLEIQCVRGPSTIIEEWPLLVGWAKLPNAYIRTIPRLESGNVFADTYHDLTNGVVHIEGNGAIIGRRSMEDIQSFRRLLSIELANCHFDLHTRWEVPSSVRWLNLANAKWRAFPDAWFSDLGQLEWLNLSGCNLTNESLTHLSHLKKLRVLDLTDNPRIDDAGMGRLAILKNLRILRLNDTRVSDNGATQLATSSTIEWLEVIRTGVTESCAQAIERTTSNRMRCISRLGGDCRP